MVGIRSFPIGEVYFQVLLLLVSGRAMLGPKIEEKKQTLFKQRVMGGMPIGSMYDRFTHIWLIFIVYKYIYIYLGINASPMDPSWNGRKKTRNLQRSRLT